MKYHQLMPTIVRTMCWSFDAWIVGSAAPKIFKKQELDAGTDFDVIVPPKNWNKATLCLVPYHPVINSFGGWKIVETPVIIDVWPDTLNDYFLRVQFSSEPDAFHPKTGIFLSSSYNT